MASPPPRWISSPSASARLRSARQLITTRARLPATVRARAAPRPSPLPVTSTTFPRRLSASGLIASERPGSGRLMAGSKCGESTAWPSGAPPSARGAWGALLARDPRHLRRGGDAAENLLDGRLAQGAHALLARRLVDVEGRGLMRDRPPQLLGHGQDLEHADAAAVAGLPAVQAAAAALEPVALELLRVHLEEDGLFRSGLVLLGAMWADLAHQALSEDADEGGREQEVGDAEVEEARDGGGRVVGVESGEDEVAGEGCLDRLLRRFRVPDLAHHDDVGILAEHGAEGGGERHLDLRPHRDLVEVLEHHLDRVLDGDDVHLRLGEVLEHGVQGGGLAAAGGTGDEDDPGGPGQEVVELGHVMAAQAQLVDALQEDVRIEDAQHGLLAERGRHGRDAQLDLAPSLLALDAPVLR